MKVALSVLALASTASAFVPANVRMAPTSLAMSEEVEEATEAPVEEEAAPAEPAVPLMEVKEKVPCFGATPLLGEPVFFGENYWDKITTEWGSEETGTFVRA